MMMVILRSQPGPTTGRAWPLLSITRVSRSGLTCAGDEDRAGTRQGGGSPAPTFIDRGLIPDGAAVGAAFAACHVDAGWEAPDDLPAADEIDLIVDHNLVPALLERLHDGRVDRWLYLDIALLAPEPARYIETGLGVHAVVEGVDDHLNVPLRLHVPAHDAERPNSLPILT